MDNLTDIVHEEVFKYAGNGRGANIILFTLADGDRGVFAVNAVDYPIRKYVASLVVMARLIDNQIVIEEDTTDKRLLDALLQRGIQRRQIILAYQGEPIPDAQLFELDTLEA